MKKYKFQYSIATYILLVSIALLTAIGGCWNIFNLVQFSYQGAIKIICYVLIIALCLTSSGFSVSALVYGKYTLTEKELTCRLGLLKTAIALDKIRKITHFKTSNKLVMYYEDKYAVIVINPEQYEDFILSIRELNGNIEYDVQTDGEDTPK